MHLIDVYRRRDDQLLQRFDDANRIDLLIGCHPLAPQQA